MSRGDRLARWRGQDDFPRRGRDTLFAALGDRDRQPHLAVCRIVGEDAHRFLAPALGIVRADFQADDADGAAPGIAARRLQLAAQLRALDRTAVTFSDLGRRSVMVISWTMPCSVRTFNAAGSTITSF